jgi:hypothetical protein
MLFYPTWFGGGSTPAFIVLALSALLMGVLAARLAGRSGFGVAAAMLVAVAPATMQAVATPAPDGLWIVPIVMAWLLLLLRVADAPGERLPWLGAVALVAASAYAQPSALVLLPVLLVLTMCVGWRMQLPVTSFVHALAVLAAGLLPWAIWIGNDQQRYQATWGTWFVHAAHLRDPVQWLFSSLQWSSLAARLEIYWDFFSPAHLWLSSARPAYAGVFATPTAILVTVGLLHAVARQRRRSLADALVITMFLLAGLAPALFGEARATTRGLIIVPLGVALAIQGLAVLWYWSPSTRLVALAALGLALAQSAAVALHELAFRLP